MGKGDKEALLMAGVKRVSPELSDLSGLLYLGSRPESGIEETRGGRLLLLSGGTAPC